MRDALRVAKRWCARCKLGLFVGVRLQLSLGVLDSHSSSVRESAYSLHAS